MQLSWRPLLLSLSLALPAAAALAQGACGTLETHYGPFDYRTDRAKLPIVEQHHFTPGMEAGIAVRGPIEGEYDYTLRAFPNHPRALLAMARLYERRSNMQPGTLPMECYFERALRFRADDHVVRMLYAQWLGKAKRADEAVTQLNYVRLQPDATPYTQYNVGMLLFDLGRYDDALRQAHLAKSQGMKLSALEDKLKAKGQWREPAAEAATPAGSAPAAASAAG